MIVILKENHVLVKAVWMTTWYLDYDAIWRARNKKEDRSTCENEPPAGESITCSSSALLRSMTSERQFSCQTILQKSCVVSSKGY